MICLCQCLCQQRHCIVAIAFDESGMTHDEAKQTLRAHVESLIASKVIDGQCRICLGTQFTYEVGRTKAKTMEELIPNMLELERANKMTGDFLEVTRKARH